MKTANLAISLSIIIPVFRDYATLAEICDRFEKCIQKQATYEIVFINDGNIHNVVYFTLEKLRLRPSVRVIHLSRNFGQHVAITAGMKNARGAYHLVLDSDLQYLPEDCFEMYQWAKEKKSQVVLTVIEERAHSLFKKITANIYYTLMTWISETHRKNLGSAYLLTRHVTQGLLRMGDRHRMTVPMIFWLGGDIHYYPIPHHSRGFGKSNYSFYRLVKLGILGIVTHSNSLLYLSFILSTGFSISALGIALELFIQWILQGRNFLSGWLSTILVILVSVAGIFGCLGIIGLYLAKVFENTTGRPLYFVEDQGDETAKLFEEAQS